MRFVPGNAQDIGTRESQQDSFAFFHPDDEAFRQHGGLLALIADGMGGLEQGEAAGRIATKAFLAAYSSKSPEESIPTALERATREANSAVYELGKQEGMAGDIGTTLVAVVVHEEHLYWIAVGDSPLQLLREGELTVLTLPHTYELILDRKALEGEISEEEARGDPEREYLTSYLGMEDVSEFDHNLRAFPLRVGDRVLLSSDGLTKTLSPEEIATGLEGESQDNCEALVQRVLAQGHTHQDNVTVISFNVEAEGAVGSSVGSPTEGATDLPAKTVVDRETAPTPVKTDPTPTPPRRRRTGQILAWCALFLLLLLGSWFLWQYSLHQSEEDQVPQDSGVTPSDESLETRGGDYEPGSALPVEKQVPPPPEEGPPPPEESTISE